MGFTFFAFDSRFFWEDVYNHQGWVIQQNVRTLKYRLVDAFSVRRYQGTFEQCRAALLKYIEAYELGESKKDTVIVLHGFGQKKSSVSSVVESLKDINANIIAVNYATLRRGVGYHANILAQMLQNIETKGKLYIINVGAGCLITRRMLTDSRNYRRYNIERVLDINPINSGSDLAQLFIGNRFVNFLLGPMLRDIATPNAVNMAKLPQEIDHGIILAPGLLQNKVAKMMKRFESMPPVHPPSESSYAAKVTQIDVSTLFALHDEKLLQSVKNFITTGSFLEEYKPFDADKAKNVKVRRVRKVKK